jgi:hypothetical protein
MLAKIRKKTGRTKAISARGWQGTLEAERKRLNPLKDPLQHRPLSQDTGK